MERLCGCCSTIKWAACIPKSSPSHHSPYEADRPIMPTMADGPFGFSAQEWRTLQRLKTPQGIQRMLDSFGYHDADTAWSPRRVLSERRAHCCEGAVFAAAALRAIGKRPLV